MSTQTQEDIIREQVSAKTKHAASVAAAGGNVAKAAFLATITGAKTPGEKAVVFGALMGVLAFFLPWAALLGTLSTSGLQLALHASAWVWLYPASMIFCFVLSWFLMNADWQKHILAARWFVVIGTLWTAPGLAALSNMFSGALGFGFYLAVASAGALLIGGLLQISQGLKHHLTPAAN